jgi:hypothetical protein
MASGPFEASRARPRRTGRRVLAFVLFLVAVGAAVAAFLLTRVPSSALEIISSPTGARVTIDGRAIDGVTPVLVRDGITEGTVYAVGVQMDGYRPWASRIQATRDTLRQFVVLAPLPATLRIETEPEGAMVSVNGVERGAAPLEVTDLLVGQDAEVRVTVPGRPMVLRHVRLGEGTTTERILIEAR